MLGKEEGKNLQLIHSTILYLFSRSWHQRETSFKEYLHMVHTSAEALSKKACVDRRQETLICSFQWNFFHLLSFSEPALSKITLQVNQAGIGAGARLNTEFWGARQCCLPLAEHTWLLSEPVICQWKHLGVNQDSGGPCWKWKDSERA